MKVAIVGYGWLGLPLANNLEIEGKEVFGTSTSQLKVDKLNEEGLKTFYFSGEVSADLKKELTSCDWIILTIPPSGSVDYVSVLEKIVKCASQTCKVIFTSSIGVYQEINGLVNEQSALKVDHPVLRAENFLQEQLKDRNTILRLGGLIGNGRHPVKYLAGRNNLEGAKNPVNLIHLEDVIEAIKVIIDGNHTGHIFNLVFPEHPTKQDYYSNMAINMNLADLQFADHERNGKIVSADAITKFTKFEYLKSIFET